MSRPKKSESTIDLSDEGFSTSERDEMLAPEHVAAVDAMHETKSAKFRRLVGKRMSAALKRIEAVGNLGNRAQYEYSPENANQIVDALSKAVIAVQLDYQPKVAPKSLWNLSD